MAAIQNTDLSKAVASDNLISMSKTTINGAFALIFNTPTIDVPYTYANQTARDTAYDTVRDTDLGVGNFSENTGQTIVIAIANVVQISKDVRKGVYVNVFNTIDNPIIFDYVDEGTRDTAYTAEVAKL